MMRRYLATMLTVLLVFSVLVSGASATTNRTIDLTSSTNDFAADENLGGEAGRTGYLTWDATNLYIGIVNNVLVDANSNVYVVVDSTAVSNADPRSGAGRSDQPTTDDSGGATYPFNADVVFRFYGKGPGDDSSVQNPASGLKYTVSGGSWSSASIASGVRIFRRGGATAITKLEIPFSELGISSDAEFNILFYVANNYSTGSIWAQWPTGNAGGTNPTLKDFYTYTRKSGISPNAGKHYSYREDTTSGYSISGSTFGSIFFVPGSPTTYSEGSLDTLGYHLFIGSNATFNMSSGGSLSVAGNWTKNGTFTHNSSTVTFNGTSEQTIGGSARTDFGTVTINSGATVAVPAGTTQPRANTVNNNGTLKQTSDVNASTTVDFLKIRNTGDSADTYRGVDIVNGSTALGSTTVSISGNQASCPNAQGYPAKRCYDIADSVAGAVSADVRFYIRYAELQSAQTLSSLNVWHYTGSWQQVTKGTTGSDDSDTDCEAGEIACYVTGTGITSFSPFVLKNTDPTAVTLADFHAAQQGDAVLVAWETASELDNRGFNLYRGVSPDGWDRQLNTALIPSQSQGNPGGFIYTWEDRADLVPGTTYYYWLEDLDVSGATAVHGPVSVAFVVPTAVTLGSMAASPAVGAAALPWLWIVAGAGAALGAGRLRRRG